MPKKKKENILNPNHPAKGDNITVEPIRKIKDVQKIQKALEDNPRDLLLFTIGIQSGLRCGDLLKLRVDDVKGIKVGGTLKIIEGKTRKENVLAINKAIHKALGNYIHTMKPEGHEFLFKSRKGYNNPLTIQSVNALVKKWTKKIKGNYGAHSLRKTWGYHQRINYGVGWEIICERYNHSNPAITMRYLGIEKKEVTNILMNEIGA